MDQHDGFPGPVIFVIDLNRRRILLTHRDAAHYTPPAVRIPLWSIWAFSPGTPESSRMPGRSTPAIGPRSSGQLGTQHPFLLLETPGDLDEDVLRGMVVLA